VFFDAPLLDRGKAHVALALRLRCRRRLGRSAFSN
jgi:hypothetical protein